MNIKWQMTRREDISSRAGITTLSIAERSDTTDLAGVGASARAALLYKRVEPSALVAFETSRAKSGGITRSSQAEWLDRTAVGLQRVPRRSCMQPRGTGQDPAANPRCCSMTRRKAVDSSLQNVIMGPRLGLEAYSGQLDPLLCKPRVVPFDQLVELRVQHQKVATCAGKTAEHHSLKGAGNPRTLLRTTLRW